MCPSGYHIKPAMTGSDSYWRAFQLCKLCFPDPKYHLSKKFWKYNLDVITVEKSDNDDFLPKTHAEEGRSGGDHSNSILTVAYVAMYRQTIVFSFGVHPEFRKSAIGTALMRHIQSDRTGLLELEVECANEPAIKFYEKLGFHQTGQTLYHFYGKNQHGIKMYWWYQSRAEQTKE